MTQFIPQTDPRANYIAHRDAIDAAVARVLAGGRYILGEEVRRFEEEFAAFVGVAHAAGVASGTDALVIALKAAGVAPGDGVITVSHTAVATVAAVELAGAVPILVDIDAATLTLDPVRIEPALAAARAAGTRVRCVVPVHLYGHPADMPAIMEIAGRHDLLVVEDCAQAHGAELGGRACGTWGKAASFSFYPTKNLGAIGDGGAVVTNDPGVDERIRLDRQYGWRERYVSDVAGMNSRLDELQAAILRVKLESLGAGNDRRRAIAAEYDRRLAGSGAVLPGAHPEARHVYHQYVLRVGAGNDGAARDAFRERMQELGVGTLVHYPEPVHRQPAYRDRIATPGGMAVTERAARQVVSLPMYPELSDEDVTRAADAVLAAPAPAGAAHRAHDGEVA